MCKLLNIFGKPFVTSVVNANTEKDTFNTDEEEIKKKYTKYRSKDPFPSILPALLNSADIHNYILATGMIFPYHQENLKPVTYGIKLTNADYLYWEGEKCIEGSFKNYNEYNNKGDKVFKLKSNSILYVSIEPYLRLPLYIAARFNLKIDYIHKGILLGTGPVVDPGFEGRLCVPLHNLTNNDYDLIIDSSTFIWMEFTKVSTNEKWNQQKDTENKQEIPPINYDNRHRTLGEYVSKAHRGSISSSMEVYKIQTDKTLQEAEKALNETKSLNKAFLWAVVASLVSIALALYTFTSRVLPFEFVTNKNKIEKLQNQIEELNTKIDNLNTVLFDTTQTNQQTEVFNASNEEKVETIQSRK